MAELFGDENEEKRPQKGFAAGTPALDAFSRDLIDLARKGKIDPIIGRDEEIERVIQILSRRKKNNPVLVGEPGVGKTAIVEGIAIRIVEGDVPMFLQDKKLYSLDLTSMVAGTKYRGQFEERMKSVVEELESNPDVIIFIDELHTMVGAGGASGSMDASNIFKPSLARGEVQCIGATTFDEYREHIESDGALERRFQTVTVEEPSAEECIVILKNIKSKYEDYHLVEYSDEVLEESVKLSERYLSHKLLPDKAIDVMDEVGARVRLKNLKVPKHIEEYQEELNTLSDQKRQSVIQQKYEEAADLRDKVKKLGVVIEQAKEEWNEEIRKNKVPVELDHIAEVISMMSGVPVNRLTESETSKLGDISDELKDVIIGQDPAIESVALAIQRNRMGLRKVDKPIGTFIFSGSTGTGKTFLAKKLAEKMFDSEDSLIRFDMSEFSEKFSISKLIGSPPGYVGYEEGGALTEKVKRKPYSVILLDEIEKAHPEIFNVFLQVLDDGVMTDGLGRRVDFKNTMIIMTSNVGARQLQDFGKGVGFSTSAKTSAGAEDSKEFLRKALAKHKAFSPEFLNRIDEVIVFNPLNKDNISEILDLHIEDFKERLDELGHSITISKKAREYLLERSYDEKSGARQVERVIQKNIEDVVAEHMLKTKVKDSSKFKVDVKDEKIKISTVK